MLADVRICIIYDCLFPHTVGGAERWYRNLAERLVDEGHEVTYLTLRQWDRGETADLAGGRARVVSVGPRMACTRRTAGGGSLPPLVFGLGVFWHLLRHGRRYDVVHTASFPYFSLLAAGALRPLGRYRARGRLARGLEPRLLARVPGPYRRARSGTRCSASARGCPSAPSASRGCTPRRLRERGAAR